MTLKDFIRTYNSHVGTPAKFRIAKRFGGTVDYLYLEAKDIYAFADMFSDVRIDDWNTALFDETRKTTTGESYNAKVLMITLELDLDEE